MDEERGAKNEERGTRRRRIRPERDAVKQRLSKHVPPKPVKPTRSTVVGHRPGETSSGADTAKEDASVGNRARFPGLRDRCSSGKAFGGRKCAPARASEVEA